ncbi:hypothetical protein MKZ38_010418 [Zalerion maritima]|uniref:Uncharacterized protein n=1 Tax=Zalerion maritima TaxID=339359 RepID=A0AAD5RG51_9PEZI|nr:hypothetical protein MKZ38_010418 [Zalerion maritima]
MNIISKIRESFSLHTDLWDPSNRFETSWCIPPYALAIIRGSFSLYIFTTLLFIIGWECAHDDPNDDTLNGCSGAGDNFSYFTTLTYWGLAFYFAFSAVHTFTYARYGKPLLERWPRALKAMHSCFYTTITTYPFIVTAVYWALLFDGAWFPTEFKAWTNISQHAMNSGFAFFEIAMTRTDVYPWAHIFWLVIVLALYLGLAYVTLATKGFYTYSFLDPEDSDKGQKGVAAYIIGILVGIIVLYHLIKGIIWVRRWLTERVCGFEGRFAKQRSWRRDEELAGSIEMK